MASSTFHGLERKRFSDANKVADWLNQSSDRRARKRLTEMVLAMQALADHAALLKQPDKWAGMPKEWHLRLNRLEHDVNSRLERYVMQEVMLYYPGTGLVFHAAYHPKYGQNAKYSETLGPLLELFKLALRSEVWRLRTCDVCSKWFCAKTKSSVRCEEGCIAKKYRTTKEFQKKNANYQRRHYRRFLGKHQQEWRRYYEWFDLEKGKREARTIAQARQQMKGSSHGKGR